MAIDFSNPSCKHNKGTFIAEMNIEFCNECGAAVNIEDFMQKIANKFNAPVFGQMVGLGTVEPEKED